MASCNDRQPAGATNSVIGSGQMPNLVKDNTNALHLVYGSGDSILYTFSTDGGNRFSNPSSVAVLPGLAASHTRGPQIAATGNGLLVTACNAAGDIFSFVKDASGDWQKTGKVNDRDTVAKENLMALSADGQHAFAVWLDLRDKHNKIFGAASSDGGKTWDKNILVYASPDTTVCECCKPSVVMKGKNVYVMFRNWLNGNRDMYLSHSPDGGATFSAAQKIGAGSWKLNGCPMDGGGLAIAENDQVQTIWRREGKLYGAVPGMPEAEIGTGKNGAIASVNGKNVYAWVEEGSVVVMKPQGLKQNLGKGQLPVIKAINNEQIVCVWEAEKQIHKAVLEL